MYCIVLYCIDGVKRIPQGGLSSLGEETTKLVRSDANVISTCTLHTLYTHNSYLIQERAKGSEGDWADRSGLQDYWGRAKSAMNKYLSLAPPEDVEGVRCVGRLIAGGVLDLGVCVGARFLCASDLLAEWLIPSYIYREAVANQRRAPPPPAAAKPE
jgi:hypothetical protein